MKLVDIVCHTCEFDKWEIEFSRYRTATGRCPNCGELYFVILTLKPQSEWEEE